MRSSDVVNDPVRALVEKWRRNGFETAHFYADELEAALASGPRRCRRTEAKPEAVADGIDYELVADMLTNYAAMPTTHRRYSSDSIIEQARLLRAADNRSVEGAGTAHIHTCSYQCTRPACIRAQRDALAAAAIAAADQHDHA